MTKLVLSVDKDTNTNLVPNDQEVEIGNQDYLQHYIYESKQ